MAFLHARNMEVVRGSLSELVHVGATRTQSLMFTMTDEQIYGLPSVLLDSPQGKALCLCPGLQAYRTDV